MIYLSLINVTNDLFDSCTQRVRVRGMKMDFEPKKLTNRYTNARV